MNVHHLELFYYVARHGGIAEAVRKMPYGIQQPAISAQIIQLEEHLGTNLFRRRPFELTESGRELFQFIEPFFANLEATAERVRGGSSQRLRIGASNTVLRDYLPSVLIALRKRFPRLQVRLVEGFQNDLLKLADANEIDLAVTSLDPRPPSGLKTAPLLSLPLVLLAAKGNRLNSAAELWERERIDETLISLPAHEAMCREFQRTLAKRRVEWFTGIEVSSLSLVTAYVASGFGLGLSVAEPGVRLVSGARALALDGFPPIRYGLVWQGRLSPVAKALADIALVRATELQRIRSAEL